MSSAGQLTHVVLLSHLRTATGSAEQSSRRLLVLLQLAFPLLVQLLLEVAVMAAKVLQVWMAVAE